MKRRKKRNKIFKLKLLSYVRKTGSFSNNCVPTEQIEFISSPYGTILRYFFFAIESQLSDWLPRRAKGNRSNFFRRATEKKKKLSRLIYHFVTYTYRYAEKHSINSLLTQCFLNSLCYNYLSYHNFPARRSIHITSCRVSLGSLHTYKKDTTTSSIQFTTYNSNCKQNASRLAITSEKQSYTTNLPIEELDDRI